MPQILLIKSLISCVLKVEDNFAKVKRINSEFNTFFHLMI